MAVREIRKFNDPILRKQCKEVAIIDDRAKLLLDDMAETMYHTPNCGGLAACQIGILKRLVVIDVGQGLFKLVNPVITESQGEQLVLEGCMSFPNVWGKVKRPSRVIVQAMNENGDLITIHASNEMMVKCLCHEIDHLNGIVFVDQAVEFVRQG